MPFSLARITDRLLRRRRPVGCFVTSLHPYEWDAETLTRFRAWQSAQGLVPISEQRYAEWRDAKRLEILMAEGHANAHPD